MCIYIYTHISYIYMIYVFSCLAGVFFPAFCVFQTFMSWGATITTPTSPKRIVFVSYLATRHRNQSSRFEFELFVLCGVSPTDPSAKTAQKPLKIMKNHEKREKFAGKSLLSCRDPCWGEPAVCFQGCFCPEHDLGWQKKTGYLIRASPDLRMAASELDWIFATIKSQHVSSAKLSGWWLAEWSPINDPQEENQPLPFGKSNMSPWKIPESFLVNTIKNGGVSMATC